MRKEHKKLYKAGKNWLTATIAVTTVTFMGVQTAHADTSAENSTSAQVVSTNDSGVAHTPSEGNSHENDGIIATPTLASAEENSVQTGSSTTVNDQQASPQVDSNIYGTVNVKDWDYENNSDIFNLTGYHGQDTRHIVVPNLNDFNDAGIEIGQTTSVGISSTLTKNLVSQSIAFAISKTSGEYNNKVIATDNDWSSVFASSGLVNADLSNLDTSNITNMKYLFAYNKGLKTVGILSEWDTGHVSDMASMFYETSALQSAGNIGKWNTRNVTSMNMMFTESDVSTKTIGHWNTSKVVDMGYMFHSYKGEWGDLSNWDVSNVKMMVEMFVSSDRLGELSNPGNITKWKIKNGANLERMFSFDRSTSFYRVVASNENGIIPNQVTIKDNSGNVLAIINTPTIYYTNKSVKSAVDEIVQAEVDQLNKSAKISYGIPKIASSEDDDYSIANAVYVVGNEQILNISYRDGMQLVSQETLKGLTSETIKLTSRLHLPAGYQINHFFPPKENYTFKAGGDSITVDLEHIVSHFDDKTPTDQLPSGITPADF